MTKSEVYQDWQSEMLPDCLDQYLVYICGKEGYTKGVPVDHVSAKDAAEAIAHEVTGIQRVKYLGTVKGCSKREIHVYEDEHSWIYNVVRMA